MQNQQAVVPLTGEKQRTLMKKYCDGWYKE